MFDLVTTAAVAGEIRQKLVGGRVQMTGLTAADTVVLEVYANHRRHYLLLSAGGDGQFVAISEEPVAVDPERVKPFALLLRKNLRGGLVTAVEQPELERIIEIEVQTLSDDSEEIITTRLVAEIMGRRSNVVLVSETGKIVDAIRRVPPSRSSRALLPGLLYRLPPVQDRLDPRYISGFDLATAANGSSGTVAKLLVDSLRAVSPQMAAEIAWNALGSEPAKAGALDLDQWNRVAAESRQLLASIESDEWSPVIYNDGESVRFAAKPQLHLQATLPEEPIESISEAVLRGRDCGDAPRTNRHSGRLQRLAQEIGAARDRAQARVNSIEREAKSAEEAQQYRHWGETIYAWLWSIEAGQTTLEVEGETIPLLPDSTPKETAEHYFERYRKLVAAAGKTPDLIENAQVEVDYLDQLLTQVEQAETFSAYEELLAEWIAHRGDSSTAKPGKPPKRKRVAPLTIRDSQGNTIWIGKSGHQNDQVTFDVAIPGDYWLHARGIPGAHVILRPNSIASQPSPELLERAAAVAAWYSKGRAAGRVEVDITLRRHVRKIKGGPPGLVTYRNESTVLIPPQDEEGFRTPRP